MRSAATAASPSAIPSWRRPSGAAGTSRGSSRRWSPSSRAGGRRRAAERFSHRPHPPLALTGENKLTGVQAVAVARRSSAGVATRMLLDRNWPEADGVLGTHPKPSKHRGATPHYFQYVESPGLTLAPPVPLRVRRYD